MKQRRFSDQLLFALRNYIPIGMVIEKILGIALKKSHGALRFPCPWCGQFNTAINHSTNLARCFRCETNFNPIDMVMAVKNTSFVEAVTLLKDYKANSSHDQKQAPKKDSPADCLPQTNSILKRPDEKLVAIGDILSRFLDQEQPHLPQSEKSDSPSQNTPLAYRITKLEQDVHRLSVQVEQLKSIICNQK